MVFGHKLNILRLMRAPPPGQAIYVSKGEQDHGPFSFEELVERMGKGQFAPTDLAWHQGVSNWMALEQLPEWPTIQEKMEGVKESDGKKPDGKSSVPPPPPAGPSLFEEVAQTSVKVGTTAPSAIVETARVSVGRSPKSGTKEKSSGVLNKILVGMAILFFLATVGFAGFILYKKWDTLGL